MVNMLNPKNWIWVPLFSAGFVLILLAHAGHAALLKDIRVGEYKNFTRIVFELDVPAASEKIERRSARQLAVVLENTSTDLIRKIPLERSPHVSAIQIWEKGDQLTAILAFDFDGFSQNSFSLPDPPRLVLDIHPRVHATDTGADSSPTLPAQDGESNALPSVSASSSEEPAPQPDAETVSENPAPQTPKSPPGLAHKQQESMDRSASPAMPPESETRSSDARPSRLQVYLVVVLVAITIVILALLLLMLLARRRWIDVPPRLAATEDTEITKKT
jgi:hypothetical protein